MSHVCRHGQTIYCDWTECSDCCNEHDEELRHEEQMEVLNKIASRSSRASDLEDEVRRLRAEVERMKKGSR